MTFDIKVKRHRQLLPLPWTHLIQCFREQFFKGKAKKLTTSPSSSTLGGEKARYGVGYEHMRRRSSEFPWETWARTPWWMRKAFWGVSSVRHHAPVYVVIRLPREELSWTSTSKASLSPALPVAVFIVIITKITVRGGWDAPGAQLQFPKFISIQGFASDAAAAPTKVEEEEEKKI